MELILLLPFSCRPPLLPLFISPFLSSSPSPYLSVVWRTLADAGLSLEVSQRSLVLPSFPLLSQHTGHKQIMNHPRTPCAECIGAEVGGEEKKLRLGKSHVLRVLYTNTGLQSSGV